MDTIQAQMLRDRLQGKSVGGWEIDGCFGHGKSAVVMRGRRGAEVAAIKVFHPELVERFGKDVQLERIRRETSLVGIEHPNVVRILDGGECQETGNLYVAMEALTWGNLKQHLLNITDAQIRPLISQLAAAAKFLEGRGLAHRDIKPENIAVSEDLSELKLLDLGVLRPFGVAGLTDIDARVFIGTLRYSSPEFLTREEVDSEEGWRALTFYQIGAVIHDMLTRQELFHDYSEPFAVLVDAVKGVNPEVRGSDIELVRLCRNCLVKDPGARLQLVSWGDFSETHAADNREALLRRIRERQRYYSEIVVNMHDGAAEEQRVLNQRLQTASSSLDYKLGRLLTTLKCFPLHSIKPSINGTAKTCGSSVVFESDMSIGLSQALEFAFLMRMVEENGERPVYVLDACATIGNEIIDESRISAGELEDVMTDKPIEEWMLRMLGAAYEAIEQATFRKD